MTDITRRTAVKTIGALGVVGIAGTGTAAADSHDVARVRIAHASPNAPPVDVAVNGDTVVSGLAFTEFAPDFTSGPAYLEVPEDEYDVKISATADSSVVVFEDTVPFKGTFTVAAIGELDIGEQEPKEAFRPLIIEDDLERLPPGLTRFRAVHASPDAPAVQVRVGSRTVADDLAFGEASDLVDLTPGTKTVTIAAAGGEPVVFEGDVTFRPNTVYTAFAEGYLTPDDDLGDAGFQPVIAAASADRFGRGIEQRQEAIRRRVQERLAEAGIDDEDDEDENDD
jgi:hypothetical protein